MLDNKIRLSSKLIFDSIVDGPGLRIVLWTQGCLLRCPGCHNPQTWSLNSGFEAEVDDLIKQIKLSHLQSGITFSGGEPFLQPEPLIKIAKVAKSMGLNVWSYSGYTYGEIIKDTNKYNLLKEIDALVDGPFVLALKSYAITFRGSSNQRIINVQKSLKENKIILFDEYK